MTNPIRRAALNYLARRDHSYHELALKLQTKGFSAAAIHPILEDLVQTKLLCDQRFTENFVRWRRAKGIGPQRIMLELEARGIAHETIAEQLQIADNAWFAEARRVWQKHFRGHLPVDYKSRAKQIRFLQQRGYTREHIETIIGNDL